MRPLTLHISALTDSEYTLYTRVLKELLDTDQLNLDDAERLRLVCGKRERGYGTILRFFSPGLEAGDTISGGELFAVLRMVVHVEQGKEVSEGWPFPTDDTETEATGKKPPIPRRPTVISLPSSTTITESTNPFTAALPTDPHFSHPHPHPQPPPQHPRRSTEIQPPLPQPPSSSSASLPASAQPQDAQNQNHSLRLYPPNPPKLT
ncbi:hypothetical protein BDQ17DRAFT_1431897 [Cyathus striatus]|nr:hypothetical protein BDQ17DRAFT_1431897 [Cyathus striatus]